MRRITDGGGLKGLQGSVPEKFTTETTCGWFCASCALLSDKYREVNDLPATRPQPITGLGALMSRLRPAHGERSSSRPKVTTTEHGSTCRAGACRGPGGGYDP